MGAQLSARSARATQAPPALLAAPRRALRRGDRRAGAGRARLVGPERRTLGRDGPLRPRGGSRAGTARRPTLRPEAAPNQRDRAVDAPVPRVARARRSRLPAGRGSGL